MKPRRLILVGSVLWVFGSVLVFGMSPVRESFDVQNSTSEDILLTIRYRVDLALGAWELIDIYSSLFSETFVARTNVRASLIGSRIMLPDRRRSIFYLYIPDDRSTDSVSAVEKFLQVVEEFTIQDSAGNILLSLEDLDEDSFVTYQYAPHEGNIAHILQIRTVREK